MPLKEWSGVQKRTEKTDEQKTAEKKPDAWFI